MAQGLADYVPISIALVTALMRNRRIAIDVALIQVSPPDAFGYVSLGVSVDIVYAAASHAGIVIAEINPNMPRTMGETFLHVDGIDHFVWADVPVIEYFHEPADEVGHQIARYIAAIIEDGATLQMGLGRIPNAVMRYLGDRRDLGIHSDVITDSIVPLVEQGVINGKRKSIHRQQIVASFCIGSRRLYDLIDGNPLFSFHPIDYVCDPTIIAKNRHLVSITQAFAVDLTGQVCADQYQGEFYGGVAAQPDFLRAAALSEGGKPIICLPSTTEDGGALTDPPAAARGRRRVHRPLRRPLRDHRVRPRLPVRQVDPRARARPDRDRPSQVPRAPAGGRQAPGLCAAGPGAEKQRRATRSRRSAGSTLKNGTSVLLRPARASDAKALQGLFYLLPPDDVYTRFFHQLKSLTLQEAERYCNVDHDTEVAFLAMTGEREDQTLVGSACYFVNPSTNMAEVAYMIAPEWQGSGLGTALQRRLVDYAKSRGLLGFTAEILATNTGMIRLAKRACDDVRIERDHETLNVTMRF